MQRLITLCLVIVLAFGAVQPAAAQSVHPSRVDPAPLQDKPDRIPPSTPAAPATESHGVSDGAWTAISDPSFAWTACTDEGGSSLAGYNVYWGTDPAATSGVLQVETSYLPAAFTPPGAATYYLRVQSKDGAGNTSPWVTLFTYRYDSVAPLASGVITEGHGVQSDVIQGTVYAPSFAWEAGIENDSGIQSYQVYWGSDPNASQPLETPVLTAEERSFTPEPVLISGSYYLRVFARDAAGNLSPASDPFVFRYQGTAPAPQVTGIAIDPGAVNLVADPAARLNYGPQSGGAFQLTVSTGQVGPFDVGLKQIVFPNLFSTSDGTVIDLSGEMNPASYNHTYTLPAGATASGSFDVQVVSLTDQVTSAGFEVAYDATPPVVEGFQLDLAGLQNGYVSGTTLYYGPASTGNLAMTLQASDASGVGEMSFPALFQLEAQTLPGGEPEAVYSRSYAVDGMIDTTAGTFEVLVIDRVGNQAHTAFTLVKDSTAPTLTLNAPGTAGLLFEVAWSGQDAEAGLGSFDVQVWDGTTWSDWLSDTTDTQTELVGEEGPNRVRVVGRDRVGNLVTSPEGVVSVSGRTKYYQMSGQVVAMRQGNELSYLSGDHLGSTSLVTNASGQVVAQARYYPFGEERWSEGGLPTDKTFTGQRSETFGLMDYNARFYDPTLGRFISPDIVVPEIGNSIAWDRYAYVKNNPINLTDPSGHMFISDEDTRTRNIEILSDGGKEIHKLYETWEDVYGDLSEQEFFGWMMAYEMNGLQKNKFTLDGKPATVLLVMKDVVARQLFGDSLKSGGHMPYCYSSECTNGLFNFLANYAQVARDRAKLDSLDPLGYPPGYQQIDPVKMLRDELLVDSESFTYSVLNASPASKTYGDDLPYHWGNAEWGNGRAYGSTDPLGLVYRNGSFLIFTANQGPKR